jgi:hypothetical protein
MAARAPKQWQLSRDETINSFENWRQNLLYILSLDNNFAPFLENDVTWQKKTTANPHRGLQDDAGDVPQARRKTAAQKSAVLDVMLGQIANYCSVIARNSIIKGSISLPDIWQKIRQHMNEYAHTHCLAGGWSLTENYFTGKSPYDPGHTSETQYPWGLVKGQTDPFG